MEEEEVAEAPASQGRWLAPLAGAACGALGGALGVTLVASAGPVLGGGAAVAAGAALVTRALTSAPEPAQSEPPEVAPENPADEENQDGTFQGPSESV